MSVKKPRPILLEGKTYRLTTGCGDAYVTVNTHEGKPFEVFMTIGKGGVCAAVQCAALGSLVSLALRCSIPPEEIVKKLKGIVCNNQRSCADAMAAAIESSLREDNELRTSN